MHTCMTYTTQKSPWGKTFKYFQHLLLFSCWVMSDSLQPHGLLHSRLPCPSLSPRVFSDLHPLNPWYHPNVSSSAALFFCLQSFPASESFPTSQIFASGGQNIGASALASVLPINIQGWFPLGLIGLISLESKGLSRVFSSTYWWQYLLVNILINNSKILRKYKCWRLHN